MGQLQEVSAVQNALVETSPCSELHPNVAVTSGLKHLGAIYRRWLDPLLSKGYSCQKIHCGASHMPMVGR